jgi:limonene-1,2-epoxide hydrolase
MMQPKRPREVVEAWIETFNRGDADGLAALYAQDAVNHQVMWDPLVGREAIRAMFVREFGRAEMVCIKENLFEDGDWAVLEWRDPKGLRGCGFFRVSGGLIAFQRGYWDEGSSRRRQGLEPAP